MAIVVVTDHVFPSLKTEERLLGQAGHVVRYDGPLRTPRELHAALHDADAILNCYTAIPAEVLARLEHCRVIARYGIGLDTIDVPVATARGIIVTNVPDYCIDEVSDHALALIMDLARGVSRLGRSVRAGGWSPTAARPLRRIRGRVLGLVGFGRIARALAAKAQGIGYRVIATDPFVPAADMARVDVDATDLDGVVEAADVVSIHVPLTDETFHLFDDVRLARMKPGAVIVNTSRGPIVDGQALLRALESGHLGGAALDVLEFEPPDTDDPLLTRDDVVITPHAAFYSDESLEELQRKATEQVIAALDGRVPPYAVNAEVLGHRA